jgi:hypothetical protein
MLLLPPLVSIPVFPMPSAAGSTPDWRRLNITGAAKLQAHGEQDMYA